MHSDHKKMKLYEMVADLILALCEKKCERHEISRVVITIPSMARELARHPYTIRPSRGTIARAISSLEARGELTFSDVRYSAYEARKWRYIGEKAR